MIVDPWALGVDAFDIGSLPRLEGLLAQGNGYLGARAATEERYVEEDRRTVVAPVFDRAPGPIEVPEAVALPDVLAVTLHVDGHRLAFDRGGLSSYRRVLHLDDGRLVTTARWTSPTGVDVRLDVVRVVSLADPHVLATRVDVAVDRACTLVVDSGVDGRMTNDGVQHLHELDRSCIGTTAMVHDVTTQSGVEVVVRSTTTVTAGSGVAEPVRRRIGRRSVDMRFRVDAGPDAPVAIEKVSTFHTSRDREQRQGGAPPAVRSEDEHAAAVALGVEEVVARSAAPWAEFWRRSDVEIDTGDPLDQLAVRHALYHLRCMTSQDDDHVAVGAKGLTGQGYQGHAFWDTEVYVLPVWLHVDPPTARRLLRYRIHLHDGARRWAAENGHAGAMVPWEAAHPTDGDATPTRGGIDARTGEREVIDTGSGQLHVSAVVAHAIDEYVTTTGDDSLLADGGLALLCDIARFWVDRVEGPDDDGAMHLTGVIGPDEYSIDVDDNTFTNHLVRRALTIATDRATDAGAVVDPGDAASSGSGTSFADAAPTSDEVARWRDVAERLVVAEPDEDGVIDQDTTFRSLPPLPDLDELRDPDAHALDRWSLTELPDYRVAKQADVVALLMLDGSDVEPAVQHANLEFYEPLTVHDSSLSAPTFGLVAARVGATDLALEMWERARLVDHGPDSGVAGGVHAAALGGIWQCVVRGFAGTSVDDGVLHVDPHLPPGWRRLRFRVSVGGEVVVVTIEGDEVATEVLDDRP